MLAYLDGQLIPHEQAAIPVWDYGFTMGVTVTEQLRTFDGKLFFLEQHLKRLRNGLSITNIDSGLAMEEIGAIAERLVEANLPELQEQQELGVGICVTPGAQLNRAAAGMDLSPSPTVFVYTTALDPRDWAVDYEHGIRLVTVEIREIPDACLPRGLKCRSRMHYFLAEQQAQLRSPGSRALLLDMDGFMAEGTTGSVVMVKNQSLIAPQEEKVLPGTSWAFVQNVLAAELGIEIQRKDISLDEVYQSDEVLWLSTSTCILPVAEVNGQRIGSAAERPMFDRLMDAWSKKVGVRLRS